MTTTSNSTEYKILKFLYDSRKDVNIVETALIKGADITKAEFDKTSDDLIKSNYIEKIDKNGTFVWNICDDGKIRLAKMETDVSIEGLQYNIDNSTKSTENLTKWVAYFSIASSICMVIQVLLMYQQNSIQQKLLEKEDYKQQEMQKSSSQETQSYRITIRL